jgi:hypothetical protein
MDGLARQSGAFRAAAVSGQVKAGQDFNLPRFETLKLTSEASNPQ